MVYQEQFVALEASLLCLVSSCIDACRCVLVQLRLAQHFGCTRGSTEIKGPSITQMINHGSVSFGKFAFESLSWEKRSVFTHNECQDELERFKSPGLVATKKAYFEDYYKKIRVLKAMQNQQTELCLEYGADGSIPCQTGDEDAVPLTCSSSNELAESISQVPSEEMNFKQICNFDHAHGRPGLTEDVTLKKNIEPLKSCCEVKKEENYNDSASMQNATTEILTHRLSTDSQEIQLNENRNLQWSFNNDSNLKVEPDLTPALCSTESVVLNTIEEDVVPAENTVLDNNKPIVHSPKDDCASVPIPKKHDASVSAFSKSCNNSLSKWNKASMGTRHLQKKIVDKGDTGRTLDKKTSTNVRKDNKHSFVTSQQSPSEVQNKVAIQRPGHLSKERKVTISTNAREHVLRSQLKNSERSESRKFNPKGKLREQGDSREMVTQNIIKNRESLSKSLGHEEFQRNLNRYVTAQRRAASDELKTRSINLSSRNNQTRYGVISSLNGDKIKKANPLTIRKYEGKVSKISTTPKQNGNIKADAIQKPMGRAEKHEKKSLVGELPTLNGKKSRKDIPRWR